jgi:TRAP-type C4-dicarboxylate transport system substrate-binding protein
MLNLENEILTQRLSEEKNDFYKKALAEKGMNIVTPPAKLVSDMKQVGSIMLADWQKRAGPDGEAMVAAYLKSAPKAATAKK